MNETLVLPNPVLPRCRIEDLFPAGFLELLRLVPGNPLVRALILRGAGQLPPPELRTFAQLQQWIETNCEKPAVSVLHRSPRSTGGIQITVEFSETEYGRASYSVSRSGSERFHVGGEDLLEIIQSAIENEGGLDEVVEVIADKIDDDAWNQCEPSLDQYGDYDYGDHDSTGSDDSETSYSRSEIRQAVLAFVREHHPALAGQL